LRSRPSAYSSYALIAVLLLVTVKRTLHSVWRRISRPRPRAVADKPPAASVQLSEDEQRSEAALYRVAGEDRRFGWLTALGVSVTLLLLLVNDFLTNVSSLRP
jgi:hypothetical protein